MVLPSLVGEHKEIALQVILWNAETIDDLFDKLKPELSKLMTHR
jgi:hypothetical protein